MADQVGELEGTHAKTAGVAQQGVEGRAVGGAFLQQAQAFGVERPGHAVDDEAGGGFGVHRLFTPGACRGVQPLGQRPWRGQAGDDLDQGHQRRRIEEVHADHPLGVGEAGGQAGDRQR
ncbi:hypothetical protein D3C78_649310 [compost metagenome]